MKPEEYGEKYPDHFLEQYKLYVEMADRVSQRREQSNRFYVTLLAAIASLLILAARLGVAEGVWPVVFLITGVFGVALSVVWHFNINSYRQLNRAKFDIIGELEKQLPSAPYADEWKLLRPQDGPAKYIQLTRVERFVPVLFGLLFLGLAGYAVCLLLR